jgi:hypothetical protein
MVKNILVVCFCAIIICFCTASIIYTSFQIKIAKNINDANYNNIKVDYEALREHPNYKDFTLEQYIKYVDNIESPTYYNWKYSKVSFGRKNLKNTILGSSIQIIISIILLTLTIYSIILYFVKRK